MEFDVIVAGAGPAGAASAILLARAGLKVAVVDPDLAEGFKPGESVPGAITRLLTRLNLPPIPQWLPADAWRPCTANVSAWGSDNWTFQDGILNPEGGGWHVDRRLFEKTLIQAAFSEKIEFIKNRIHEVQPVEGHAFKITCKSGLKGTTPLYAHRLIEATGRAFATGRKLGFARTRLSDQMAVAGWFQVPDDCDLATRIKSVPEGWWYTALLPNQIRVVVFHGLAETVAHLARQCELFQSAANDAFGINFHTPAGPLKTCDASMAWAGRAVAPNWIAVGDAALSFDPLAAQGIFFALYSAIQAASVILEQNTENQYLQSIQLIKKQTLYQRQRYYTMERRFTRSPYWQQTTNFAGVE